MNETPKADYQQIKVYFRSYYPEGLIQSDKAGCLF